MICYDRLILILVILIKGNYNTYLGPIKVNFYCTTQMPMDVSFYIMNISQFESNEQCYLFYRIKMTLKGTC